MSEEKMSATVHGIHEAMVKRDTEKLVSFFTEDASLITPEGTFKGKEEIARYFTWIIEPFRVVISTTVNLIIQGDKAAHEYVIEATSADGTKVSMPSVAMYDFKNGKTQEMRGYLDRLMLAQQLVRGRFSKRIVDTIVKQAEKGL